MFHVPYKHSLAGLDGPNDLVERTSVTVPMQLGYYTGALIGATASGAGIGYVVSRKQSGVVTGAAAAGALWAASSAVGEFFLGRPIVGGLFAATAVAAGVYAWNRRG